MTKDMADQAVTVAHEFLASLDPVGKDIEVLAVHASTQSAVVVFGSKVEVFHEPGSGLIDCLLEVGEEWLMHQEGRLRAVFGFEVGTAQGEDGR